MANASLCFGSCPRSMRLRVERATPAAVARSSSRRPLSLRASRTRSPIPDVALVCDMSDRKIPLVGTPSIPLCQNNPKIEKDSSQVRDYQYFARVENFGKTLQAIMDARRVKPPEVIEQSGVSRNTVYKMLKSDDGSDLNPIHFKAVLAYLRITVEDLVVS